jgi:hypothetical protein
MLFIGVLHASFNKFNFNPNRSHPSIPNLNGLQNYWPINGDLLDYASQADMSIGTNVALRPDRFNNTQSALYLNIGYCTVPPGVYFNGAYTITAWVKEVQANSGCVRLLDFGNGQFEDNIIISISQNANMYPYMTIVEGVSSNFTSSGDMHTNAPFALGVWTHLASVFDGSNSIFYINGALVLNQSANGVSPRPIVRQNCFIGRSNWYPGDWDASAYFDQIKIYNRAMSGQEILADMNF